MNKVITIVGSLAILVLLGVIGSHFFPVFSDQGDLATQIVNLQAKEQVLIDKASKKILPIDAEIKKKLKLLNITDHKKANEVITTCFPNMALFPEPGDHKPPLPASVKNTTNAKPGK